MHVTWRVAQHVAARIGTRSYAGIVGMQRTESPIVISEDGAKEDTSSSDDEDDFD